MRIIISAIIILALEGQARADWGLGTWGLGTWGWGTQNKAHVVATTYYLVDGVPYQTSSAQRYQVAD